MHCFSIFIKVVNLEKFLPKNIRLLHKLCHKNNIYLKPFKTNIIIKTTYSPLFWTTLRQSQWSEKKIGITATSSEEVRQHLFNFIIFLNGRPRRKCSSDCNPMEQRLDYAVGAWEHSNQLSAILPPSVVIVRGSDLSATLKFCLCTVQLGAEYLRFDSPTARNYLPMVITRTIKNTKKTFFGVGSRNLHLGLTRAEPLECGSLVVGQNPLLVTSDDSVQFSMKLRGSYLKIEDKRPIRAWSEGDRLWWSGAVVDGRLERGFMIFWNGQITCLLPLYSGFIVQMFRSASCGITLLELMEDQIADFFIFSNFLIRLTNIETL